MRFSLRKLRSIVIASVCLGVSAATLGSQEAPPQRFKNVVSANPIGLLIDLFNAEYERSTGLTSTVGVGGSTSSEDRDFGETQRYLNLDVFYRYYPSGMTYEGWNFGAKVGVTQLRSGGSYLGYGFDINRSWLLGPTERFYVGTGFGLKRLIGAPEYDRYVPTFRFNIGRAF